MVEYDTPVAASFRSMSDMCQGLPAAARPDARVLVLGSMPGAVSLREARYYAHPRNRFWPLMQELCGVDPQAPYTLRMQMLMDAGVGLWDVIGRCRRRGSLDASIVRGSEVANPLPAFLQALPELRLVACNGTAAHRAFMRFITPELPETFAVPVLALPSTSPANAAASLQMLRQAWQPVADALAAGR